VFDALMHGIGQVQGIVFENAVEPALYRLGLMDWAETVFDGLEIPLLGALTILLAYLLFRPLEMLRPVERWRERRAVRTDISIRSSTGSGWYPRSSSCCSRRSAA